jgi:four helix bundle protein
MILSYRDLKAWQAAMDLVGEVHRLTKGFPREEVYGISMQMRRAAVSVPSNIAEGHARQSTKEFLQFIAIALGSLAELETQLLIAARLGYLEESRLQSPLELADSVGKMLRGLQKSLRRTLVPSP